MSMNRLAALVGLVATLQCFGAMAQSLEGLWLVDDQPAWVLIEAQSEGLVGRVVRHDARSEAVDRIVMRDIEAEGSGYRGMVWAEQLGEFRKARISVEEDTLTIRVKVAFFTKTVVWSRASDD
jgi:hypothetical protein